MKLTNIISAIAIGLFAIFYIITYVAVINNPSLAAYSTLFFISLFFTPVVYATAGNSINIREMLSSRKEIQTYWLSVIGVYVLAAIGMSLVKHFELAPLPAALLLIYITWKLLPTIASTNEKSYSYYLRSGYLAAGFTALALVMDGNNSSFGSIAVNVVLAFVEVLLIGFLVFPPLLKYAKNLIPKGKINASKEEIGVSLYVGLLFAYFAVVIFVLIVSKIELYVVDLLTPTGVLIIGSVIAIVIGYQTMNLIGRLFATIFTTNEKTVKMIANSIIISLIVLSVFMKVTNFDKNLEVLNKTQKNVGSLVDKIENKH